MRESGEGRKKEVRKENGQNENTDSGKGKDVLAGEETADRERQGRQARERETDGQPERQRSSPARQVEEERGAGKGGGGGTGSRRKKKIMCNITFPFLRRRLEWRPS